MMLSQSAVSSVVPASGEITADKSVHQIGSSDPLASLHQTARDHGCRYFAVAAGMKCAPELSRVFVASNISGAVIEAMERACWLEASIPHRMLQGAYHPVVWRTNQAGMAQTAPKTALEQKLLADHQLHYGLACPVHGPNGQSSIVIYTGRSAEFGDCEIDRLQMAALQTFERVYAEYRTQSLDAGALTNRECDCLYWTAAGKTSSEIGTILTISQHTVNHYLTGAIQKLNAINRTQAVVKALHYDLIEYPPTGQNISLW